MTTLHPVLFLTDRGERHQAAALAAAPPELDVTMLRCPSKADVLRLLPDTVFLVSERSGVIDAEMIAAGRRLRLIQRLGSLSYDIDLDAARRAGVPVAVWPLRVAIMVAEHMVLQMLALNKRLHEVMEIANAAGDWGQPSRRTDEDIFAYNWSDRRGIGTLSGMTVGILGFGEIGAELARRLRGFGPARVVYHKRTRLPASAEAALGISYGSRAEVVAGSDVLCVLLPYAPSTDHLLNADLLATMRPGALLVSAGSGSVIDEAALAQAVREGHLAGAALDTYEWEPLRPGNPLLPLARDPACNVLLTPHTAAGGTPIASHFPPRREEYTNLLRVLRGEPLLHQVA